MCMKKKRFFKGSFKFVLMLFFFWMGKSDSAVLRFQSETNSILVTTYFICAF